MNARSILALLVTAVAIAPAPAVLAANEGSIHVDVSAPKWSESRFELAAGQAKKISVTLRY